jgi:hypothetical protein
MRHIIKNPAILMAAALLLVALAVAGSAAEIPPIAHVVLERLTGDPARENQVLQFMAADAKGRVFLLHGDSLAVDQILPSGKIVSWRKAHNEDGTDAELSDAALSPDGSSWLLARSPHELSLLSGDDLRQLPALQWLVSAVSYTTDGPVLAVLPMTVGGGDVAAEVKWDKPPFLLRLEGQSWQTLSAQEELKLVTEKPPMMPSPDQVSGERAVRLAAGPHGSLWVALQNGYLLKRYSRNGTVVDSIAVNGGHVRWKERTAEDWKALDKMFGRTVNRSQKVAAVRVSRGLTAQGNRVYQVVETTEGVALDRWDATTQSLDRVLLEGIDPGKSYLSLAAGRDGLYIAARVAGQPIWRLAWQQLEEVKWAAVPDTVPQRAGKP